MKQFLYVTLLLLAFGTVNLAAQNDLGDSHNRHKTLFVKPFSSVSLAKLFLVSILSTAMPASALVNHPNGLIRKRIGIDNTHNLQIISKQRSCMADPKSWRNSPEYESADITDHELKLLKLYKKKLENYVSKYDLGNLYNHTVSTLKYTIPPKLIIPANGTTTGFTKDLEDLRKVKWEIEIGMQTPFYLYYSKTNNIRKSLINSLHTKYEKFSFFDYDLLVFKEVCDVIHIIPLEVLQNVDFLEFSQILTSKGTQKNKEEFILCIFYQALECLKRHKCFNNEKKSL